jgi:hypothetical protein
VRGEPSASQGEPSASGGEPFAFRSFQRGGSAPRELERAREDRRDAMREDPVPAHPQLTLLDPMSRQVYASNFPVNSDAGPAATYSAPSEVYSIRPLTEEEFKTIAGNVAPYLRDPRSSPVR